jgi:hypothetical protein
LDGITLIAVGARNLTRRDFGQLIVGEHRSDLGWDLGHGHFLRTKLVERQGMS